MSGALDDVQQHLQISAFKVIAKEYTLMYDSILAL